MNSTSKQLKSSKNQLQNYKKKKLELEVALTEFERKNFDLQEKILVLESERQNKINFEKDLHNITSDNLKIKQSNLNLQEKLALFQKELKFKETLINQLQKAPAQPNDSMVHIQNTDVVILKNENRILKDEIQNKDAAFSELKKMNELNDLLLRQNEMMRQKLVDAGLIESLNLTESLQSEKGDLFQQSRILKNNHELFF